MTHSNDPGKAPQAAGTGRSLGVAAIDPVPIFRDGLSALVQRTPGMHWAGYAANPHAALQLAEQVRPDVVLIDTGLDPHGHLTKLLVSGDPALLVIVLIREVHRTPGFLNGALSLGAHAVVPRSVEPRRLIEAIRRAYLDRRYVDPSLAPLAVPPGRSGLRSGEPGLPGKRPRMPLSRREYQVLQLVAEGLENAAIAKILYLSTETVRTHVKSILRKLSARDRTHAVTIAFRAGILIAQPDDSPERAPGHAPPPGLTEYPTR
ncbi:MAG TPA: response regulator transcription factor [Amycolatopsis sp.]|uniref:response regulator transcription factor n=1 Tax=Amycolatopsis sp. TaxID=37632 RepID=UPI002B49B77A|nr:response regulator transcription factor [Amycolatopsis sp.]HKS46272.1 response regulator transcription factor [Amycolatopsis sp.]